MARSEAIRSGALEITMAINLARSRSRAHPSKSRTICAATESCASVSTCGRGGRRSEHLHVGTHVRVGEHPKQIGLAQPLARDAHGDASDELWLESMAYLWGEGERAP